MNRRDFLQALAGLAAAGPALAQTPPAAAARPGYSERCAAFVDWLTAAKPRNPTFPKEAMTYYVARLVAGRDTAYALAQLGPMMDKTLREPRQDPFNLHAILHGYLLCPSRYPAPLVAKFQSYAAGWDYTRPIGVSLNYELMRDGAGWLAAQTWPQLVDKAGNPASKIQTLCGARLMKQYRETTARNASEYDAPVYYGTDFAPARMVAEFARDPQLREAARLCLHFMLIHTAAHWHRGYHISAAGRGKYWGSIGTGPDSATPTNATGFLLFGGDRPANLGSAPQGYWMAHPGRALPLDWLPAWQAALPDDRLVLASHPWPAHRIHVRKLAWFTRGYGLASQREDGTEERSYLFKECRRTLLRWVSPHPCSVFTICQDNRRRPQEKIPNAFCYGENPYAQVLQFAGTLLGVYDVPQEYGFWRLRAPFTTRGAILKRIERGGWICCHGGSVLFGFKSVRGGAWGKPDPREGLELFEYHEPRNGWILETSPVAAFAGGGVEAELARFADALVTRTKVAGDVTVAAPRLIFTNLASRVLDLRWKPVQAPLKNECQVDGRALAYDQFPLLKAPNLLHPIGGPLTATLPGGATVTYDFTKWTMARGS